MYNFDFIYMRILRKLCSKECLRGRHEITNRKGEKTLEFLNTSFKLVDPRLCFALSRDMSLDYLMGETEFYLGGSPFLLDISKHSKFWNRVSDDGRSVFSNYGKLVLHDRNYHNYTQFEYARDMLLSNSDTKKAVMSIYSKENAHPSKDNPCTMYIQFFIRDNKLTVFVKMRSSDIWYGLPYDVPFFVLLQYKMLLVLNRKYHNLTVGSYNHQSGSLHLIERNFEDAKEVLGEYSSLKKGKCELRSAEEGFNKRQIELFHSMILNLEEYEEGCL